MAFELKMPKVFGGSARRGGSAQLDIPTAQVRSDSSAQGYDPLASVSLMDPLRTSDAEVAMPRKLPVVGRLPTVRQFQILGILLVVFILLAGLMLFLEGRFQTQAATATATATEMQMLSQRVARSTTLVSQGQMSALDAVKNSRQRFKADIEALTTSGGAKGVSLDSAQEETATKLLQDINARWEKVDADAGKAAEANLSELANGLDAIRQGSARVAELAQLAVQQAPSGVTGLREVDYARDLGTLAQRIARSAASIASAADVDPDVAAAFGRDVAAFHEALSGLTRADTAARLPVGRGDDLRATLAELAKRAAAFDTGAAAVVQYAGPVVGGMLGVLQINAVVPTGSTTGAAVPVVVTIGTASTVGATLVVK